MEKLKKQKKNYASIINSFWDIAIQRRCTPAHLKNQEIIQVWRTAGLHWMHSLDWKSIFQVYTTYILQINKFYGTHWYGYCVIACQTLKKTQFRMVQICMICQLWSTRSQQKWPAETSSQFEQSSQVILNTVIFFWDPCLKNVSKIPCWKPGGTAIWTAEKGGKTHVPYSKCP